MPDELIHLLKNVKSFSEAKRIVDSQFVKREEDVGEAISVAASIKCPVPRNATVTTTYASSSAPATPLYLGSGHECKPRLATVKLSPPSNGFYYPSFINLHRCTGSCGFLHPNVWQCEVTAQEEIKYSVYEISLTNSGVIEIKVMNHTGCACDCVVKEHHCDADTMRYNKDICRCECINDESSCDTSIKKWNEAHCVCECKFPPAQCSIGQVWSTERCECQ